MNETLYRMLTYLMGVILVLSLVGVGYVALTSQSTGPTVTEFYVLGTQQNASDYPETLAVGETGKVILGITNREGQAMQYVVVVRIDNRVTSTRNVTVANGETWERPVTFTPRSPGKKRVGFLLYRTNPKTADEPYRQLRIWVNVTSPSSAAIAPPLTSVVR